MDADRQGEASACQATDSSSVARSGVACPAKQVFGRSSRASPARASRDPKRVLGVDDDYPYRGAR
jgi:hypothetical protein